MAKRFIDTGLFDDSWFMELSKDGKIFWLYIITKCDHAGIIELNRTLCSVQTGINDYEQIFNEFGDKLINIRDNYFFIPKFLKYQYPSFPNSKVKAQQSAIEKLKEFNLFSNGLLTLKQGFKNSYEYGNENGYGSVNGNEFNKIDLNKPILDVVLPRKEIIERFELISDSLKNDEEWKVGIKEATEIDITEIEARLQEFINLQRLDENINKTLNDYKSYFRHWVKKQIKNKPHENSMVIDALKKRGIKT